MKPWTTGEIRLIEENINLTDKKLAAMLGRSFHSVKRCRKRYGLTKRALFRGKYKLSKSEINEIRSSRKDVVELAYFYGISINTVYNYQKLT